MLLAIAYGLRRLIGHVRATGSLPRPTVLRELWAAWQGRWAEVLDARDRGAVRAARHAEHNRLIPGEAEQLTAWLRAWPSRPTVAIAGEACWAAPAVYDRLTADAEAADAVLLCDADGELAPEAVAALAAAWRGRDAAPDAVLGDEYRLGSDGAVCDGLFRPGWSPELAESAAIYRRPLLLSAAAWRRLGRPLLHGPPDPLADSAMLRGLTEVVHVPRAVAHVRTATLAAAPRVPPGADATRLSDGVSRRNQPPTTNSQRPSAPEPHQPGSPLVSILIPTRDQAALLIRCVESLMAVTAYREFELLILDNGSTQPAAVAYLNRLRSRRTCRVLSLPSGPEGFNYSAINNRGAEAVRAESEFLLLLNNDTETIQADWLGQLVTAAQRPGVGAVGPKLIFPDGGVQQAGMVLDVGHAGARGHVEFVHRDPRVRPPSGVDFAELTRNVAALGAACLLLPTRLYRALGGLEERSLRVGYSDIDLCGRIRSAGYRLIYAPASVVVHHESRSRGPVPDWRESAAFARGLRSLPSAVRGDPFHNANLASDAEPFELLCTRRLRGPWAASAAVLVWLSGTPDAALAELRAALAERPELRLVDVADEAAAVLRYGFSVGAPTDKPTVWLMPERAPRELPAEPLARAYRVLWPSAEARRRGLRLNVAGNFGVLPIGPDRAGLQRLAERSAEHRAETRRRLGLGDAVPLALPLDERAERLLRGQLGWVTLPRKRAQPMGWATLLAADAVVAVPATADRVTRPLTEAATLGRPLLVGTDVPGPSPGWCEHFVPNRAALSAALARVREPTFSQRLSQQASAWAECRPSLADSAAVLSELLREAADLRQPP